MLDYIYGNVDDLNPAYVIVDCNGLGYEINISLLDYEVISKISDKVKLYIYESIRDDAHVLFGFTSRRAREMFKLLISVSGVGPNTARLILSALSIDDLESVIVSGNDALLKSVKGIGGKTAQRIIVDLKDKIKLSTNALISQPLVSNQAYDEALSALTMLGFMQGQSQKVLKRLFSEQPELGVEEAIKRALKMM